MKRSKTGVGRVSDFRGERMMPPGYAAHPGVPAMQPGENWTVRVSLVSSSRTGCTPCHVDPFGKLRLTPRVFAAWFSPRGTRETDRQLRRGSRCRLCILIHDPSHSRRRPSTAESRSHNVPLRMMEATRRTREPSISDAEANTLVCFRSQHPHRKRRASF